MIGFDTSTSILFVLVNTQKKRKKVDNKKTSRKRSVFFVNFNIYFHIWSSTAQSQMAIWFIAFTQNYH